MDLQKIPKYQMDILKIFANPDNKPIEQLIRQILTDSGFFHFKTTKVKNLEQGFLSFLPEKTLRHNLPFICIPHDAGEVGRNPLQCFVYVSSSLTIILIIRIFDR